MKQVFFSILWAVGKEACQCKQSLEQEQALVKFKLCLCPAWKEGVADTHSFT